MQNGHSIEWYSRDKHFIMYKRCSKGHEQNQGKIQRNNKTQDKSRMVTVEWLEHSDVRFSRMLQGV